MHALGRKETTYQRKGLTAQGHADNVLLALLAAARSWQRRERRHTRAVLLPTCRPVRFDLAWLGTRRRREKRRVLANNTREGLPLCEPRTCGCERWAHRSELLGPGVRDAHEMGVMSRVGTMLEKIRVFVSKGQKTTARATEIRVRHRARARS